MFFLFDSLFKRRRRYAHFFKLLFDEFHTVICHSNFFHHSPLVITLRLIFIVNHFSVNEKYIDEIEDESADDKVVINQTKHGKTAFWGAPRAPMSLAISPDLGLTWQVVKNLDEGNGYCMSNNSQQKINREFSYPSIIQGQDGTIHISYTYFRQAIKYVRITDVNLVKE